MSRAGSGSKITCKQYISGIGECIKAIKFEVGRYGLHSMHGKAMTSTISACRIDRCENAIKNPKKTIIAHRSYKSTYFR